MDQILKPPSVGVQFLRVKRCLVCFSPGRSFAVDLLKLLSRGHPKVKAACLMPRMAGNAFKRLNAFAVGYTSG